MKLIVNNKNTYYVLVALFSIPLFFLNVRDIHNWGDDYAQYVKEAQNIAHCIPYYQSSYIYNNLNPEYAPPSYPPGFPLLLAPIVKIYGISIRPMLYLISGMVACILFTLLAYFKKYMGDLNALCLAIAGTYSGLMMDLKASVLSDIPLTLLITLYLVLRNARIVSLKRMFLLIIIALAAMLIKTQAVILLFAEGLFFLITFTIKIIKTKKTKVITYASTLFVGLKKIFITSKYIWRGRKKVSQLFHLKYRPK